MRGLSIVRKLGELFTFRRRRALLSGLLLLCLAGTLLPGLSPEVRRAYSLGLTAVIVIAGYAHVGMFVGAIRILPVLVRGGKHERKRFAPAGLERVAHAMGLSKPPKVFLTSSPWVWSAFTNGVTGTIYFPKSWLGKFSQDDVLSILAHELGHVKRRRRFWGEVTGALVLVFAAAFLLGLHAPIIIAQVFEVTLAVRMVPVVSWRNERHADLESAKVLGPEGLISVLEHFKAESSRDEGSETHPPLSDRISRLMKLL